MVLEDLESLTMDTEANTTVDPAYIEEEFPEGVDLLVYTRHVHRRAEVIARLLGTHLGNPSALGVKRNVLIITDAEFKNALDLQRASIPTIDQRRYRVISSPALRANTISKDWVEGFIYNHDTLVVVDDAVNNCNQKNMPKILAFYRTTHATTASTLVRFAIINHTRDTARACFSHIPNIKSLEKPYNPRNSTVASNTVVQLRVGDSVLEHVLRNLALLYAFLSRRDPTLLRQVALIHAGIIFSEAMAKSAMATLLDTWDELHPMQSAIPGKDLTMRVSPDTPSITIDTLVEVEYAVQVAHTLKAIDRGLRQWFAADRAGRRRDVRAEVVKAVADILDAYRFEGIAVIVHEIPQDQLEDVCALGSGGVVGRERLAQLECVAAANGYIERQSTDRRFKAAIDLFPALTRDPTTLRVLSDTTAETFNTYAFDLSITHPANFPQDDLSQTNRDGTIESHLSSLMRLKPSANMYTYRSAPEHGLWLANRGSENALRTA
ncbi:hypothetical protein SARC_00110 [Sphaeroforma arctica JP610]|uniref:Uncharacterized protein n=1 Tax=Sphaeroforma arctica JP610 TaxID=667725 RepID=A0A0L0GHN0_9EUKA|nr:hypothetical protein SARC_00110 [Sphaeroforma arctica JP610]KNC87853.1 hypothetical protein SARC_00110 [Sphaeroforma arctica JP610]|eukprot:XP_014161755.1 hypothetical protein SARC_00110 [Sphaeroforma arctica JP610]